MGAALLAGTGTSTAAEPAEIPDLDLLLAAVDATETAAAQGFAFSFEVEVRSLEDPTKVTYWATEEIAAGYPDGVGATSFRSRAVSNGIPDPSDRFTGYLTLGTDEFGTWDQIRSDRAMSPGDVRVANSFSPRVRYGVAEGDREAFAAVTDRLTPADLLTSGVVDNYAPWGVAGWARGCPQVDPASTWTCTGDVVVNPDGSREWFVIAENTGGDADGWRVSAVVDSTGLVVRATARTPYPPGSRSPYVLATVVSGLGPDAEVPVPDINARNATTSTALASVAATKETGALARRFVERVSVVLDETGRPVTRRNVDWAVAQLSADGVNLARVPRRFVNQYSSLGRMDRRGPGEYAFIVEATSQPTTAESTHLVRVVGGEFRVTRSLDIVG
jgi:hypothetical protein